MDNFNNEKDQAVIELNDGALCGLSDGVKMDVISAFNELIDDCEDENSSMVTVKIDNKKRELTILSVEDTDLEKENYRRLFNLGVCGKLRTKKNGVGKYSQGFKYATAHLIGHGNKGEIRVAVKPKSGKKWGAVLTVDYTKDGHYTDKYINFNDGSEIPERYNFMVKVVGCKYIDIRDVNKIMVGLGIRYRKKIEDGVTSIIFYVADDDDVLHEINVLSQDRLYSKYGSDVDYHKSVYLPWNGNDKAATWEWSDLKEKDFDETELIDYDTSMGCKGRKSGVNVLKRSGIEIAINGVTIIYDGELLNLIGVQQQQSSCGFRGRLNFLDLDFADKYINGSNKSSCAIKKSFSVNDDTKDVRMAIKDAYNTVVNRHKIDGYEDKTFYSINLLDEWCDKHDIDCHFVFSKDHRSVDAFILDNIDKRIIVNVNSNIMENFKSEMSQILFIIGIVYNYKTYDCEEIFKRMRNFKNNCEIDDII